MRKAFPNFSPDQVKPNTYSVTVSFKGTGLDVDVVPILYNGDPDWYGKLVSQDDGSLLATCIPRHLEFIRKRKQAHETDFAQIARLIKFWASKMKREQDGFRFKSFMIELILAHLADAGLDFSDYPEALQHFFTYIARSNIRELIAFDDYYARVERRHFHRAGEDHRPGQCQEQCQQALHRRRRPTRSSMPRSMPATPSMRRWRRRRNRRPSVTGRRCSARHFRCEAIMTDSYTISDSESFTVTHARHMAAKVATDLKRMQRLYGSPSDTSIAKYEAEVIEFMKAGYLGTVMVRIPARRQLDRADTALHGARPRGLRRQR